MDTNFSQPSMPAVNVLWQVHITQKGDVRSVVATQHQMCFRQSCRAPTKAFTLTTVTLLVKLGCSLFITVCCYWCCRCWGDWHQL